MHWQMYIRLSAMIFLQFAIWGSWLPVLAAYLLGPLKMNGKMTAWIYSALPLAAMISPPAAGQIADRWVAAEWLLAAAHLTGGVLLLIAAKRKTFAGMFLMMMLYSLVFAPTLPLVTSLMFSKLTHPETQSFRILCWTSIAWVLAGLLLTACRRMGKPKAAGFDGLTLAGILSLVMGIYCFTLPHTPPPGSDKAILPFIGALSMLKTPAFLVFIVVSFVLGIQLQFYFLGTARYLEDIGVRHNNIPAVMAIAQAVQILVTAFIVPYLLPKTGFLWALFIGITGWLTMYLVYMLERPRSLIICSMSLHGLSYAFFIYVGFNYVDSMAAPVFRSSAQSLYSTVFFGFGHFFGSWFAGAIMDRFKERGQFVWRRIFLTPCVLTAICATVFVLLFR